MHTIKAVTRCILNAFDDSALKRLSLQYSDDQEMITPFSLAALPSSNGTAKWPRMMQILLNGSSHDLPEGTSIQSLLQQLELGQRRVAVEVNEEIIPRSQHSSTLLNAQDQVEIVHAIGGG